MDGDLDLLVVGEQVRAVCMIHVGGTRDVTASTDPTMKIYICITFGLGLTSMYFYVFYLFFER
jgi:hypothetical protein